MSMWKYKDNFVQKREICIFLTFLMQELQRRGQITNDVTSLLFGKSHSILNMIQQLSSMNLFKDEVEPVSLFKILNQLDDVLMASAMMKGFNLFENTRSRVSRDFICKNNVKMSVNLQQKNEPSVFMFGLLSKQFTLSKSFTKF